MEKQEKSRLFKFLKIDAIIENLTGLIEARLELAKIEIKEEVARIGARIIAALVFSFFAILIIIFFSITAGALLNHLFESNWAGYATVTGFYVLVIVLMIVFNTRAWLQNKIEDTLIEQSQQEDEADEEGDR